MIMAQFDYFAPTSLQKAVGIMGQYRERAKVMAGGTDLIIAMQKERVKCDALVDIGKIEEIKQIKKDGRYLVIGSAVKFSDIIGSTLVNEAAPLLAQAASEVGSPQIRNRGTIGGNLGSASPAGDLLAPLYALDAEIVVLGPNGKREVRVNNFLAGQTHERLQPDEIIAEIRVPLPDYKVKSAFIKLGRRKALAISRLNLALYLEIQDTTVSKARLVVGAAGRVPFRVAEAEQLLLKGCVDSEQIMEKVSCAVADSLGDRPSAPYKIVAVKDLVCEAISRCSLV